MNWGQGITLTFIVFAGIIITMVTISMRQNVNLVAEDYYVEEVAYQDQIDRLKNFNALKEKPEVIKTKDQIILSFPKAIADQIESGEIHFFRPSNNAEDKKIKISLDENFNQSFPINSFRKGLWKSKLKFTLDKTEYFYEKRIVI